MKSRIAIATVVAAGVLGGTGAGFALAGGSSNAAPDGTPSSSAKPAPSPGTAQTAGLAQILGVSTNQAAQVLRQLDALSQGGRGVDVQGAGFQRLAASLGHTASQLADLLKQWKISLAGPAPACASTPPAPGGAQTPAARLAQILGVSTDQATQVLRQLRALSHGDRGVDVHGAGFQRLATSLGHTPSQLAGLLRQWKISLAEAPPVSACGSKG